MGGDIELRPKEGGMVHPTHPTGLERITTLEVELKEVKRKLDEVVNNTRAMQSLLLQGRGAVRLGRLLIACAAFFGLGMAMQHRLGEFLRWLGS